MQKINNEKIKNMPNNYQKCLKFIIKKSKNIYKENLTAIFLAGSGGKENIIDGWSDLDIYVITKTFDSDSNYKLYSFIKDNDFGIHVGTTFYNENMIKKLSVDSKTLAAFYEYTNLNSNYFIFDEIEIQKVNLEDIVYSKRELNDLLQGTIREINLYKLNKKNFKTLIKKITLLIKVFLIKEYNTFIYGYTKVFNEINKIFDLKYQVDIENIIEKRCINENEIKYFENIINLINERIQN